jgi:hypothetical protein
LQRARPSLDDVFINCPFDSEYAPIFRALIFCVHVCGFAPRSARELDDSGQLRMEKLFALIRHCRYGIHDLSRTELDEENGLPRFNMPLELGIFLGAQRYGGKEQKLKRSLVFDIDDRRYVKFISDLRGMDIHGHHADAERAIQETRDWLANVSRRQLPSAARCLRLYHRFLAELPAILDALEFDAENVPYADFERMLVGWLLEAKPAD